MARQVNDVPLPLDHDLSTTSSIRSDADGRPLPQSAQRLYVHLWNSETLRGWLGPILPWDGPWRLNVDCIAYAPAYEGRSLCGPS
jgi:hypothetical protein